MKMALYMQSRCALVAVALIAMPSLAGDLEDGVKLRRLGFMYYHGEGVRQDDKRAVELFEKAAEAGDVESTFNLGKMYEYGMSVAQDDARAAGWYRRAAELGDPAAQYNASIMYYKGQGVPLDRIEAAKWWTLAMMSSGEFAARIRPSVESAEGKLSAEEIAEGKRRAAEWVQKRLVNLDKPGVLEAIEREEPAQHRKIVEILRMAQVEPCETLPMILKTRFDALRTNCNSYQLLTSDPPKRHLAFMLAGTTYVTHVIQHKLRGKVIPAESKQ